MVESNMLKGKYKMLVSDIDGTLTKSALGAIPSENVTLAIKKVVSEGLLFSLASGRPYSMVEYLIKILGKIGPCIVDNGAVIVDSKDGTILWQARFSAVSVNETC